MSQWQKHAMLDNPWRGQKGVNSLQVCTLMTLMHLCPDCEAHQEDEEEDEAEDGLACLVSRGKLKQTLHCLPAGNSDVIRNEVRPFPKCQLQRALQCLGWISSPCTRMACTKPPVALFETNWSEGLAGMASGGGATSSIISKEICATGVAGIGTAVSAVCKFCIQIFGRWSSDAFLKYIRESPLENLDNARWSVLEFGNFQSAFKLSKSIVMWLTRAWRASISRRNHHDATRAERPGEAGPVLCTDWPFGNDAKSDNWPVAELDGLVQGSYRSFFSPAYTPNANLQTRSHHAQCGVSWRLPSRPWPTYNLLLSSHPWRSWPNRV